MPIKIFCDKKKCGKEITPATDCEREIYRGEFDNIEQADPIHLCRYHAREFDKIVKEWLEE